MAHKNVSIFNSVSSCSLVHKPPVVPVLALSPSVVTPHILDLAFVQFHPTLSKPCFTASNIPLAPRPTGASVEINSFCRKPSAVTIETARNLLVTWYASTCPSTFRATASA